MNSAPPGPPSAPTQPRAWITTSWDDGHPLDFRIAEMLAREGDRSLEGAIVRTIARRVTFTEPVVPTAIGHGRGLRTAWVTGSYPIPAPNIATATLRPFVTTQPPTLPLPNPEPEVAR